MEHAVELSVVVPVFNEDEVVEALILALEREIPRLAAQFEVVVVDDASSDATPAILERLSRDRPWLDVLRNAENAGHGASVLRGLRAAQGAVILQCDSDGQFVVSEAHRLWERRHDGDLVLGVRSRRRDPWHRLVLTRLVGLTASALAGRKFRDANTPFRLLRREAWDDLGPDVPDETLAPNVFVTLGVALRGWRIVEVPVTHLPRARGRSTLRSLRLLRFSLRGLAQLLRFRVRLSRDSRRRGVGAR